MKTQNPPSEQRRRFLRLCTQSSLLLLGLPLLHCRSTGQTAGSGAGSTTRPKRCQPTEDNIEGPFYCASAPSKTALASAKEPGQPLRITGRILQPDCQTPIANASIEIWQANAKGQYDNTCLNGKGKHKYHLRGKLQADAKGQYSFTTIFPGRYLNGPTYRPAHIHYKLQVPGYIDLTTQLYFEGDPYIKGDPFVKQSLVIKLDKKNKKQWQGRFDIVLERQPKGGQPT